MRAWQFDFSGDACLERHLGADYGSSSDAKLYFTSGTPGVPEPTTWAMLIMGLGSVGAVMRRNRVQPAFAA